MNIGMSQLLTIDGIAVPTKWTTIDANIAKGKEHSVLIFSDNIDITKLTASLDDAIAEQPFTAMFAFKSKEQNLTTYTAQFEVAVKSLDPFEVRAFVLICDGKPWAICNLESEVKVKENVKTYFDFEFDLTLLENIGFITAPWTINAGVDSKIVFGATTGILDTIEHDVVVSKSKNINEKSTKDDIINCLNQGTGYKPNHYTVGEYVKLRLRSKNNNDVVGFKALFIRILWNLGIVVYISSSKIGEETFDNLTLREGKQMEFSYKVSFEELKK